mgnify:CR=1 FL=1
MKKTISFLFLFMSLILSAQTLNKTDTLAKYSFEELSEKAYAAKPDTLRALIYAKYHLKKSIKSSDTLNIASSYYIINSITNDSIPFIRYWNKIINNKNSNKKILIIGNLNLGDFYFHKGKRNLALKKYLQAKKSSNLIKNDSLISIVYYRIGMLKYFNENYIQAIEHFKKSLEYFKNKKNYYEYFSLIFNLSTSYSALNKIDSAYFYNEKVILVANQNKDSFMNGYADYQKGTILLKLKKPLLSIKHLKKSENIIILDENYFILSNLYLNLARSYQSLKQNKNTLKHYLKVDSLFLKKGNYYKSQKPAYKYLISHYKEKKDYNKQLEYINKYIKVDSVLNVRDKRISKTLTENYDIPNLLAEKKALENRLKEDLSTSKKWIFTIILLVVVLLIFLFNQTRKRKIYKKRFEILLAATNTDVVTQKTIPKKTMNIPQDVVKNILTHLDLFEKEQQFIASEITLASLAKSFETNSKYLSQIINQYKGKSFNNYINELRINYTVTQLKTNATFRKYSVKAIANEVGFNTTESFSKAFYKYTGIKPSFFIKELEKK